MDNYYDILGIDPTSTIAEVKKAFRRKAKQFHPDVVTHSHNSFQDMRIIVQAYEVLSDPVKRELYDKTHFIKKHKYEFDYREFLKERADNKSISKLILFDMLHNYQDEAIELYEKYYVNILDRFGAFLGREDFMDCSFLLAEEYEKRGEYLEAYRLLKTIAILEQEISYFKHFFVEVIERLKRITCVKMSGEVPQKVHLMCLSEMVDFHFSDKDTAFFLKKIAEIYSELQRNDIAVLYLKKGLKLDRKLTGIKKLKEKIGYVD